jgi:hypothetical protein
VACFVDLDRLFAQIDRWKSKLEPAVTWLEGTGLKDFLDKAPAKNSCSGGGKNGTAQ